MRNCFILFSAVLLLTACTPKQENIEDQDVLPRGVSVENSHLNYNKKEKLSDTERANYLSDLAASIPDVHNATAVVIGNLAVVGIDVDGDVERSKVGTIKYSVTESLRHDPHGAGAIVVADPDLTTRLKEVGEDVRNGKPVRGIMNELADIVGRIIPDVPLPENEKDPQDAINDQDTKNKKNIQKIEREQSNDKNQ